MLADWRNPLICSAILVLLHPTSGYSEIQCDFEIHSEIAEIRVSGIKLTEGIDNRLEKRNLINEHALSCEPVPLSKGLRSGSLGCYV